ncbi:MAG: DUF6915 family protein [Terriglobia bacterium]
MVPPRYASPEELPDYGQTVSFGEQHVKEDLGRIPTAQDWLSQISPQRWMYGQRFEGITSNT